MTITAYQSYIHKSRYARFLPEKNRREHWSETVDRYFDFMSKHLLDNYKYKISDELKTKLRNAVFNMEIMPSMRALMTAGKALERDNCAGYNCSFVVVDDPKAFDEAMYILMCGGGVGFSVERQYVNKLPEIPERLYSSDTTIVVKDSKEGWAKALRQLIALLYTGEIPKWDLSKLRPAGAKLKTFGGRCLSGNTIVYKDRKKSKGYNEITIKELFEMQNSEGFWKNKPNHFNKVKIRSLNEETGMFFRNKVVAVHENGLREVFNIVTENGYRIKATSNHKFMDQYGEWIELSDFEVGDLIAVNGSPELKTGTCVDCGISISRRSIRCKNCNDKSQQKEDCSSVASRQRKEVRDYRNSKISCELCGALEHESELEIHHIDGNPWNNNKDNLLCVCVPCHRKEDMKRIHFGDAYSCKYMMFDKIIKIEYAGIEMTYDLEMEGPNHNFIANGFVSHNSSGPEPLDDLFKFVVRIFNNAIDRKLTSIECHDIMCKIGEVVVVGGVRRSAMISLSNLSDERMRHAKAGAWWEANAQRALSNNSAVYTERPDIGLFMKEWLALYESKSGERGIFNREASQKQVARNGRRDPNFEFGTNPCSEIILRPNGFCNLSEVVVRENDTEEDLIRKIELAAILGTFQSTLTYFPYLRKIWQKNAEEERLLGVSLTGLYDNKILNNYKDKSLPARLEKLRNVAIDANKAMAEELGINQSAAVTCIKPSGTVSELVDCSSGIHPQYDHYYIRRVRSDRKDPLTQFLVDAGLPHEPDIMKPDSTMVFAFPKKAPKDAVTRNDINSIEHLELWLIYQRHWCEHKPSVTIQVKEQDWIKVGAWVWEHFDELSGVSFLPYDSGSYRQAPYEKIDKSTYDKLLSEVPENIEWNLLVEFEDNVEGTQTLACTSGGCSF